jgi:protein involved in polysaccharide export with SLBB domain
MNAIGRLRVLPCREQYPTIPPVAGGAIRNRLRRNKALAISKAPLAALCPAFLSRSILFAFCLVVTICVSPRIAGGQRPIESEADLVHRGDLIDVDVVGSLDYDWRGGIDPDGYLDGLDKIEDHVFALCRSEGDIAGDIQKYYAKFLRDPKVVVKILDRSNRAVVILDGAIKKPQRFQLRRPVLLNELLVLSGGITDRSNGEISIYRPGSLNCVQQQARRNGSSATFITTGQGNGAQTINIRISDLLHGKELSNPEILSGDIVTLIEAAPIYIIGGVANPRQISARDETTLSRAIASAGGLSKDADEGRITVFRRDGKQSQVIQVDLDKVRAGTQKDVILKPLDIVSVGQRGRAPTKIPPTFGRTDPERLINLPVRVVE